MKPRTSEQDRGQTRHALTQVLACLDDPRTVDAFLDDLCTPAEIEALADRWSVVPLLAAGMSYRHIHDVTGVSVTTVGRIARYLDGGAGGYRVALDVTRAQPSCREHPQREPTHQEHPEVASTA